MSNKVLITDYVHPSLIDGFNTLGLVSVYKKDISLESVHQCIQDYVGIIINSKVKMDRVLMDKAIQLKFIGRLGSGLEIIDLPYAQEKGIHVFNSPEGNRNAVAEHAMGMIISLANNFKRADQEVRASIWDRESNRGMELEGKTIGIVGFGNTGSSLAKKLQGWDMEVLAYDKYDQSNMHGLDFVKSSNLEEIQTKADIISFHLPLTDETYHLVNLEFIKICKRGVMLINTCRGPVFDTESLVKGLESGHVGHAGIDVFENEKPTTYKEKEYILHDKLFNMSNVILTPHVAGWTHRSLEKIAEVLLKRIKRLF